MKPLRPGVRLGVGMGGMLGGMVGAVLVPLAPHSWFQILAAVYSVGFYVFGAGIIEQERGES